MTFMLQSALITASQNSQTICCETCKSRWGLLCMNRLQPRTENRHLNSSQNGDEKSEVALLHSVVGPHPKNLKKVGRHFALCSPNVRCFLQGSSRFFCRMVLEGEREFSQEVLVAKSKADSPGSATENYSWTAS